VYARLHNHQARLEQLQVLGKLIARMLESEPWTEMESTAILKERGFRKCNDQEDYQRKVGLLEKKV